MYNLVETFVSGYHGIGSHVEDHLIEQGLNAIRKETERYDDFYMCVYMYVTVVSACSFFIF